jgi:mannosyltransferase OCH1-like enzyme
MDHKIPRIIHQTWKGEALPEDYARYRRTVHDHHPDWEHRLWTDADNRRLIAECYPWFLETYDGYKHTIERVDAVRYFILLHHGGVYIDLDMECLKPLDPLLEIGGLHFGLLASPTIQDTIIANALMAAPKGPVFRLFDQTVAASRGKRRDFFRCLQQYRPRHAD